MFHSVLNGKYIFHTCFLFSLDIHSIFKKHEIYFRDVFSLFQTSCHPCGVLGGKSTKNVERDKRVNEELEKTGWIVLRIWEHEIRKSPEAVLEKIRQHII